MKDFLIITMLTILGIILIELGITSFINTIFKVETINQKEKCISSGGTFFEDMNERESKHNICKYN